MRNHIDLRDIPTSSGRPRALNASIVFLFQMYQIRLFGKSCYRLTHEEFPLIFLSIGNYKSAYIVMA